MMTVSTCENRKQSRCDPLPRAAARLILRRLTPDDLDAFQTYRGDRVLGLYQGWSRMSNEEALAFLTEMNQSAFCPPDEWFQLAIADRTTGQLMGDIGLRRDSGGEVELGYTLATPFQGRGLATEAVEAVIGLLREALNVERVFGITDARNLASIRLLERIGMLRTKTADALFRGEACVEHTYVLNL